MDSPMMVPGMDLPSAACITSDFKEHTQRALAELAAQVVAKYKDSKSIEPKVYKSINEQFQKAFPDGFAVEVTETVCGPPAPVAVFRFRHVAKFSGVYSDRVGRKYKGTGQIIEVKGMCEARLDMGTYDVTKVEMYYTPQDLIQALIGERNDAGELCPISGKPGACPLIGITSNAPSADVSRQYEELMRGRTPANSSSGPSGAPTGSADANDSASASKGDTSMEKEPLSKSSKESVLSFLASLCCRRRSKVE